MENTNNNMVDLNTTTPLITRDSLHQGLAHFLCKDHTENMVSFLGQMISITYSFWSFLHKPFKNVETILGSKAGYMPDLAGMLLSANLWSKHPNEKAEVVKWDEKQYLISWRYAARQ